MKITNKQLKKIIKEELALFEGASANKPPTQFYPHEIYVYSPDTEFDYGMQQEWDQPFPEGRTHYFDLEEYSEFKEFIDFIFLSHRKLRKPSAVVPSVMTTGHLQDAHIILDEDPNETFNTYSGRVALSLEELKALDGKKMKDLLYTEPFKYMLPISKKELITAGIKLHGTDLTSILKPIKM